MSKLDKSTVALTFKFDCDRFLRYRLATTHEIKSNLVPSSVEMRNRSRPGINLITAQGRAWEAYCYDDIVIAAKDQVAFRKGEFDSEIDRHKYAELDVLGLLAKQTPPTFIIEGKFSVPGALSPGLKGALDSKRLEEASGRPDLLWIRPYAAGVPLVKAAAKECEFIIHVIDVKLAAEPSLRHFVEVTFYALGLQAFLEERGLSGRYAVAAAGLVWPGTHEASAFKNLIAKFKADGVDDPLAAALDQTTHAVPYEVYKPRLQQFLDQRLPRVLGTKPGDSDWHVSKKCQLCEFFDHCQKEALDRDALAQVPTLTAGQAATLMKAGISTLSQLRAAVKAQSPAWKIARAESHALRAQESAIDARCRALDEKKVIPIPGRRTAAMPKFAHLNIFVTAHFDPGTGITFAFGAHKVHFPGDGSKPDIEEVHLPVDSIDVPGNIMSPRSEGIRLAELCQKVQGWLEQLDAANSVSPKEDQQFAHIYVWEQMEARQLARVVARHLGNEEVMEHAAFLLRVFPPESELADPDAWKSQPLTVVKPVIRNLFALPVPFEYTLMDARNWLAPFINDQNEHVIMRHRWGFATAMSDQIPLERAYELWQDRPMLRKFHPTKPPAEWPRYTKEEIRDGIKEALRLHLSALRAVVGVLGTKHGENLLLRKEPFSLLKAPPKPRLPVNSVYVITMEKLGSIAEELENRQILAMPVEEREAQFVSMRGIRLASESAQATRLESAVRADARYSGQLAGNEKLLKVFEFSVDSRDTRLRDGTFTVVLRNEDSQDTLETKWYRAAGFETYEDAASAGHARPAKWLQYEALKSLLGVTIARIDSTSDTPLVALIFDKERLRVAKACGILKTGEPMVLDPIHRDFSTDWIEKAVRRVGGKAK